MPRYSLRSNIQQIKDAAKEIIRTISEEQEEDMCNYGWTYVKDNIPFRDFKIKGSYGCRHNDNGPHFYSLNFEGPDGDYYITYDDEWEDEPYDKSEEGAYGGFSLATYYKANKFAYGLGVVSNDIVRPDPDFPEFYTCIYLDEHNKLRAFCPTVGNNYNIYTNEVFNTDAKQWDDRQPEIWSFEKHPEFGLSKYEKQDYDGNYRLCAYNREYDRYLKWLKDTFDIKLVHEEILSRICVRGEEKNLKKKPKLNRSYEEFIKLNPQDFANFQAQCIQEFNQKYPNGYTQPKRNPSRPLPNVNNMVFTFGSNGAVWSTKQKHNGSPSPVGGIVII